ncbi:TIR domain-containing protein [Phototrophicus methaneseepsis]|uniref:TIR domain-containing protein n=1 Tax=Phototrophicus methaneseepsis TaxID=2710758 RepID=A0A7S8IDR8_9CHLR|nr:TIR domain-containing protein [Phototrophicus methaneseepsis]QPC81826.1 TIR domain-containing protein [Phototrophicus methaneseepsis]
MNDNYLFISYSRDDQVWTYNLWRALENEYDVWIDQKIRAGVDWWKEILENIEKCTCFLAVLSPKAVESIYCTAELNYAVALNKPIIPLVVKTCDYPLILANNNIQFEKIATDAPMQNSLVRIVANIGKTQIRVLQGEYPQKTAARPELPQPSNDNLQSVYEIFALAEEAKAQGDVTRSLKLFEQLIQAEAGEISKAAQKRLAEVRLEQEIDDAYRIVRRLSENPSTERGAKIALEAFVKTYSEKGIEHDKAKSDLVGRFGLEIPDPSLTKKSDAKKTPIVQDNLQTHDRKIQALTLAQLGQIQIEKRNWDAALRTFVDANSHDPENLLINYFLGELYIIKRDLDQAIVHLNKTHVGEIVLPEAEAALALALRLKGQASSEESERSNLFNEAEERYEAALKVDDKIKDLHGESYWAGLGALQRRQGRYRDAIDSYTKAEVITPDNSYPIVNLAALHLHDGNVDMAKRYYQRTMKFAEESLAVKPTDKWAQADKITCSLVLLNSDVAIELLSNMLHEGDLSDRPVIDSFLSGLYFIRESPTPPTGLKDLIVLAEDWLKQTAN